MSETSNEKAPENPFTGLVIGGSEALSVASIRYPQAVAAVVTVVYDDGHHEVHSVARGSERSKLVVDLGDEEQDR